MGSEFVFYNQIRIENEMVSYDTKLKHFLASALTEDLIVKIRISSNSAHMISKER